MFCQLTSSNIVISESVFINGFKNSSGAVFYFEDSNNLEIINSKFLFNCGKYGGSISINFNEYFGKKEKKIFLRNTLF